MAKFNRGNLVLKDNQKVYLGDSNDSQLDFDGEDVELASDIVKVGDREDTHISVTREGVTVDDTSETFLQVLSLEEDSQRLGPDGDSRVVVTQYPETEAKIYAGPTALLSLDQTDQVLGDNSVTSIALNQENNTVDVVLDSTSTILALSTDSQTLGVSTDSRIEINETAATIDMYAGANNSLFLNEDEQKLGDPSSTYLYVYNSIARIIHYVNSLQIVDIRETIQQIGNDSNARVRINNSGPSIQLSPSTVMLEVGDSGLQVNNAGTFINEFSTDATLSDNSDIALPTEKAVKTYVDNQIGLATESGNQIVPSGDNTAVVTFQQTQGTEYSISWSLVNEVDFPPAIYAGTIYEKSADGFSIMFSGPMDSANYVLSWSIVDATFGSSTSSSSSSSKSSSSSSTSAGAAGIPSWLSGFPDDPDYLEVVAGGEWQSGLAEDEIVRLYRIAGTTQWSEDGTNVADTTSNRLMMFWDLQGAGTTPQELQVKMNWATTTGTAGWNQIGVIPSISSISSGSPYSFKNAWNTNASMTGLDSTYFTTSARPYQGIFKAFNYVTNTMPANFTGMPLPPDYLQVTIGTDWQVNSSFAEDDVIDLYRIPGTNDWSESGGTNANGTSGQATTNRLRVRWAVNGSSYTIQVQCANNFTGSSSFVNAAYVSSYYVSGQTTYSFKRAWNADINFTFNSSYMGTSSNNFSTIFKAFNFVSG